MSCLPENHPREEDVRWQPIPHARAPATRSACSARSRSGAAGQAITLTAPKQRALLALLLVHPNEAVPRERLIEQLWDGRPLIGAGKAMLEAIGAGLEEFERPGYEAAVATLAAEARARGRALPEEEALALAYAIDAAERRRSSRR